LISNDIIIPATGIGATSAQIAFDVMAIWNTMHTEIGKVKVMKKEFIVYTPFLAASYVAYYSYSGCKQRRAMFLFQCSI
jgi:hypothetical protein